MVKLHNLLQVVSLGALSLQSVSAAFNPLAKRYDNSTLCEITTMTSTSVVNVYGPSYTGVVSNQYSRPTIEADWDGAEGPVFTVYIPQSLYDLTGLTFSVKSTVGIEYDSSSFVMYTGDLNNFVYPGSIYSTSSNGLVFDGKTNDPLLKIVITGSYEKSVATFSGDFELVLDLVSSKLSKRETESFDLSASVENPLLASSSSSVASSASSAAESSATGPSAAESSIAESSAAGSSSLGAVSSSVTTATSNPASTIYLSSTITQTITSCSDHKCSESEVTAIGAIVFTTVDEVVTSYTTYCPIGFDEPTAQTYAPIDTTITVGEIVTVINTACPVVSGRVETTITHVVSQSTSTTVVTLTEFQSTTDSAAATATTAATTTETATTASSLPIGKQSSTAAETLYVQSTGSTVEYVPSSTSTVGSYEISESATMSVYEGAAATSNFLSGGIIGAVVGLFLMF